jgi:membrane protease subunit HflK
MEDFEAVIAAGIKKETLLQQAREYGVNTLPAAESSAQTLIENAKVAQNEALTEARNNISAFMGLYEQYRLDPTIVMEGQLRQRISALLSKMNVVIIQEGDNSPRVVLP